MVSDFYEKSGKGFQSESWEFFRMIEWKLRGCRGQIPDILVQIIRRTTVSAKRTLTACAMRFARFACPDCDLWQTTLVRALSNQPPALNPGSRTQSPPSPHDQEHAKQALCMTFICRWAKGCARPITRAIPEVMGDAEPQAIPQPPPDVSSGLPQIQRKSLNCNFVQDQWRLGFHVGVPLFRRQNRSSIPAPHETLQATETKAAAATLVHTSIQTFSHLASAMFCPGFRGAPDSVPLTCPSRLMLWPAATKSGSTETLRSGIFAKRAVLHPAWHLRGSIHDMTIENTASVSQGLMRPRNVSPALENTDQIECPTQWRLVGLLGKFAHFWGITFSVA